MSAAAAAPDNAPPAPSSTAASARSQSLVPTAPSIPTPTSADLPTARSLRRLSPTARDRRRWLLSSQGMSPEQIAAQTSAGLGDVKASLLKMGAYFTANSHIVVDARVNELAIAKLDQAERMLTEALDAVKLSADGKTALLDPTTGAPARDFTTALKAFKAIKDFVEAIRPKGTAVALQVNNNSGNTTIMTGARSYEERLRAARERNGMRNDEEIPIAQAEEVEVDYDESAEEFDEQEAEAEDEAENETEAEDAPEPVK